MDDTPQWRCVLFDLAGVLIEEGHIIKNVLTPMLAHTGYEIDYTTVKSVYNRLKDGKITEYEFWKSLNISDYEKIRSLFIETLKGSYDETFDELIPCLKDKKTAVVTDTPLMFTKDILDDISEMNFDKIEVVEEVKISKTSPKLYIKVAEELGVDPGLCMMIDDRIENLKAAKEAGMTTVLIVREPRFFNEDVKGVDYLAPNLGSLKELLCTSKK